MKFKVDINGAGNALTAQLMAEARHKLEAALEHMAAERSARTKIDALQSPRRINKQLRRGARGSVAPMLRQEIANTDNAEPVTDGSRGTT